MIVVQAVLLAVALALMFCGWRAARAAGRLPHGTTRQHMHITSALFFGFGSGFALLSSLIGFASN